MTGWLILAALLGLILIVLGRETQRCRGLTQGRTTDPSVEAAVG